MSCKFIKSYLPDKDVDLNRPFFIYFLQRKEDFTVVKQI